ncbi:LysE family transporter [Metabacillus sp. KIGAM252]|uniref:LysE family transporter n=1 Tax=Metabacillus flavus TaxID=2823519 RepID=A0ABS5LD60_9BACI|nr:LysE family transporter [Metabacillus flavus]MBS2968680.1 LysE family transporter [Metabacillus flavus]
MEDAISLILSPLVLGISLAAPLGPVKLEMIKKGMAGGFWPSWLTGIGAITADLFYMASIAAGFLPLFKNPAVSFFLMAAGAVLLFRLGAKSILVFFKKDALIESSEPIPHSLPHCFLTGFLIAFANPFNFLFWFGIYGAALSRFSPAAGWPHILGYSFFIILGIFLWNLNVAFTVHFGRNLISNKMIKKISFAAGLMLIAFSFKLIWDFFHSFN